MQRRQKGAEIDSLFFIPLRLRALRAVAGISQMELGHAVGVSHSAIAVYEDDDRTDAIKLRVLQKICRLYGLTLYAFFREWTGGVPYVDVDALRERLFK